MTLRQLPNAITWLRVASAVPLTLAIDRGAYVFALGVAMFAALTDALDGRIARRYGWQTRFGSLLDPIADKLLLAAAFIALWMADALPAWLLALVLVRDAVIVAGAFMFHRWIAPVAGEPTRLGKLTTLLQIALVLILLLQLAIAPLDAAWTQAAIWLVALVTAASGLDYVWQWSRRAWRQRRA